LIIQWAVFLINEGIVYDLRDLGLKPRTLEGLIGILSYPLLHGSWSHLIDNSVTAFVLLFGMFSFYGRLGWQVLSWSWIMSGIWMWIAARDGNHIGFSGVIYALASFIFFSGLIRRYYRLMALSGIVVFLYGSMVWGVLPIQPQISWEGHLFGAIAGAILAYYFRNQGPQRPKYSWELEPELEEVGALEIEKPLETSSGSPEINYIYKDRSTD
jgi:membrane associated rhomboid family serine protease